MHPSQRVSLGFGEKGCVCLSTSDAHWVTTKLTEPSQKKLLSVGCVVLRLFFSTQPVGLAELIYP